MVLVNFLNKTWWVQNKSMDPSQFYVTGQSMGGFGTFAAIAALPEMFAAAVPPRPSRDMVEALKKAGATPKLTEYPKIGHGSWGRAYATAEMWAWMFQQKK